MKEKEDNLNGTKETARIEAFSDGVFAIAITLLILDIHVPEIKENETLLSSLLKEWTSILALLIGFFTILICWINHHYMFQLIHKSNSLLLVLNGFKLLVVTLTPFATAVLSKYIGTAHQQAAVNLYCFNFLLMGCSMMQLYNYAYIKNFVGGAPANVIRTTRHLYFFAGIYSTAIWLVSFISIVACLVLFAVMFLIFLSPKQIVLWRLSRN